MYGIFFRKPTIYIKNIIYIMKKLSINEDKLKKIVENVVSEVLNGDRNFKRYVAVTDFYVWASSDEDAIIKTKEICSNMDNNGDAECDILEISEQPVGKLGNRIIYKK